MTRGSEESASMALRLIGVTTDAIGRINSR
jgi:hypothetical protein